MRSWLLLSAALLASVLLGFACNTVDPGECWPNTSGGLGGAGTVPLGTGDSPGSNGRSPPLHPLTAGTPNPCVTMGGGNTAPGGQVTTGGGTGTGGVLCEVAAGGGGAGGAGSGGASNGDATAAGGDAVPCGSFPASIFKFTTILPDDGIGDAGGWQQAPVSLKYVRLVPPEGAWVCSFTVGMPLRTKACGVITPDVAADITAEVLSQAWSSARTSQPDAPGGIFCAAFKAQATTLFGKLVSLGARVMP